MGETMKIIINKFLITLSIFLFILGFSGSLHTNEVANGYSISGNVYTVVNLDDEKMSDLYLEVLLVDLYLDNKLIDSTITKNGSYKISNLKTGNYQLKFTLTDKEAIKYGFVSNDLEAKTFKIDNIQLDSD